MSQMIECEYCNSMTAQLQTSTKSAEVSWTDPSGWKDVYWAEYGCANCGSEFSRVLPSEQSGKYLDRELLRRCRDYNSNISYTPSGDYLPYHKGIGFRGTRATVRYSGPSQSNIVSRNRRRKTASLKDIKSKRERTSSYGVTEIDLELE